MDAAATYVWDDVVEEVPLPGQGPGLDGLKDALRSMRAGFSDLNFSIQERNFRRRQNRQPLRMDGHSHGRVSLGIPATGKPVRVWGIVIDRLQDGKIKNTRSSWTPSAS